MKRLCIYHSVDLDGHCSGAIVARKYPDVELYGWSYGQPIPWGKIERADEVILVDVSFQPWSEMEKLYDMKGINLIWIDHHKSAIESHREAMQQAEKNNEEVKFFYGIREIERAACELVWEYYNDRDVPYAVWLLGRWDTWQWNDHPEKDEIKAFQYGMRAEDTRPGVYKNWGWVLGDGDEKDVSMHFMVRGKAIVTYMDQHYTRIARNAFETEINGYRVLALNAGGGSGIFDSVWKDHPECKAMCTFFWTKKYWTVSLYSDRGFDCSVVAKALGGGGHAGAAGFQCLELPFDLS